MNLFIFGLGYSAQHAVTALQNAQRKQLPVAGTTRDVDKVSRPNAQQDITLFRFDGTGPGNYGDALAGATHIIHSIAPNETGDPVINHHLADLEASQSLEWMCYYSTVGVYGNFEGAWIDETSDCTPENQRSQYRLEAEQAWRDFAAKKGIPLTILRLAGIYGPDRSTFDKLKKGTAKRIVKRGQVFNRIHVEDIARVTALAAKQKLDGTFNLADDEPAPPQDVVTYAAEMLGIDPPPEQDFDKADMTPMARSFYADNKRVSNVAIKKALGIKLLYPTYREGLAAIKNTL
jgi:nucleoside-diphosphate-sugar epimerase